MIVTKSVSFEMGHRLMLHEGKCSNIHGHNYRVDVSVRGPVDSQTGMVIDFAELKQAITDVILNTHDHAIALNRMDRVVVEFCIQSRFKFVLYGTDPTAEAMAERFLSDLTYWVSRRNLNIEVVGVTVWETEDSCATVIKDDS